MASFVWVLLCGSEKLELVCVRMGGWGEMHFADETQAGSWEADQAFGEQSRHYGGVWSDRPW